MGSLGPQLDHAFFLGLPSDEPLDHKILLHLFLILVGIQLKSAGLTRLHHKLGARAADQDRCD